MRQALYGSPVALVPMVTVFAPPAPPTDVAIVGVAAMKGAMLSDMVFSLRAEAAGDESRDREGRGRVECDSLRPARAENDAAVGQHRLRVGDADRGGIGRGDELHIQGLRSGVGDAGRGQRQSGIAGSESDGDGSRSTPDGGVLRCANRDKRRYVKAHDAFLSVMWADS